MHSSAYSHAEQHTPPRSTSTFPEPHLKKDALECLADGPLACEDQTPTNDLQAYYALWGNHLVFQLISLAENFVPSVRCRVDEENSSAGYRDDAEVDGKHTAIVELSLGLRQPCTPS